MGHKAALVLHSGGVPSFYSMDLYQYLDNMFSSMGVVFGVISNSDEPILSEIDDGKIHSDFPAFFSSIDVSLSSSDRVVIFDQTSCFFRCSQNLFCFLDDLILDSRDEAFKFFSDVYKVAFFTLPILDLRKLSFRDIESKVKKSKLSRPFDISSVFSNSLSDLCANIRRWINSRLIDRGVYISDLDSTYIDYDCKVSKGAHIFPGSVIREGSVISEGCYIGPDSFVSSSKVQKDTKVFYSVILESEVGENCSIGPYAHLRPGSVVGRGVRVGNFVEIKNSSIGGGTKIPHMTYVGDANVGKSVNFGCGSVTANYDGSTKCVTNIGEGAFIGCNSNLVAPVDIEEYSYTAAGSTITQNVPKYSLAIERNKQIIIPNWVKKQRKNG